MDLYFEQGLAAVYNSGLQRARVLTESWVADQVYCPNCGSFPLIRYPNNSQIGDFYCSVCNDNFELKSKRTQFGPRVDDGAYPAMLRRLDGKANPNILLLNYDLTSLTVTNLAIIPKHFVTIDMIEKKRPLGPAARRKGWVGCRILIQAIPQSGRIAIIRAGIVEPKTAVLEKWRHTLFLRKQMDLDAKGWLVHVMKCIERLGGTTDTLISLVAAHINSQVRPCDCTPYEQDNLWLGSVTSMSVRNAKSPGKMSGLAVATMTARIVAHDIWNQSTALI
jgi:type II restriction enzyme